MALLGRQKESTSDKVERLMAKYGLENIDPQYADAIQRIAYDLAGSGLIEFGATLSRDAKAMNEAQTQYVHAILEQNFIIIRELDHIAYLLEQKL